MMDIKKKNYKWYKYASLGVSVKKRNDYADYDYLDKLNEEELNWLKGFHREYVNADFKHKHKKHYKTKKLKREIYTLNNCRNRDLYNNAKWTNNLMLNSQVKEKTNSINAFWWSYVNYV